MKGATFLCNEKGTYGQYYFKEEQIISHSVHEMETSEVKAHTEATQATFEPAYMAKEDCEVTVGGNLITVSKGYPVSHTSYEAFSSEDKAHFDEAYICVSTVAVSEGDYRVLDELVLKSEWDNWSTALKDKFQRAYYCTKEGSWGGKFYEAGHRYNGVDFCQLLPEERGHFSYDFDALDLLLYKNYNPEHNGGYKYETRDDILRYVNDAGGANRNPAITVFDNYNDNNVPRYALPASVDYTATYEGTSSLTYVDDADVSHTIDVGQVLNNEDYEVLPNDRKYYAQFSVSDAHLKDAGDNPYSDGYYHTFIVKETFDVAGKMYNAGMSITAADYSGLATALQANVKEVVITPAQFSSTTDGKFYFCISEYKAGEGAQSVNGDDIVEFHDIAGYSYAKGDTVPLGTVINRAAITAIPNCQAHFDIKGEAPVEEATLYVPASADIDALQKDRYVTAIYEYSYTECDADGFDYETRVEKHIINVRVKFLSGKPVIGQLEEPDLILPLEPLNLEVPPVKEGAFPILTGGWEIYANENDAKRHRNGHEFLNGIEPLYYYQNGYWVAYYAETRMGREFSDPVMAKVGNYQRLSDVVTDSHHMYINHRDNDNDPRIYIGDNIFSYDEAGTETYSNELDALHKVFDIVNTSYGTEYDQEVDELPGRNITGAKNLDFYLSDDVSPYGTSWTPIGNDTRCFGGSLHGNGHVVSGMDQSIFGKLCGQVYNTGVTGSFTRGGIANTGEGRVENCWAWTTGTPDGQAIYAKPAHDAVVLNSYYPDANAFTPVPLEKDKMEITQRPVEDFMNGSVAYDLNRYYLEARYRLFGGVEGEKSAGTIYRLPDGTIEQEEQTDEEGQTVLVNVAHDIKYPATYNDYVTRYYGNGDFRFADGLKPQSDDLRYVAEQGYLPLYPDDYIFFGQKLSYGLYTNSTGDAIAHNLYPVSIAKSHTTKSGDLVDNSKNGLLISDAANSSENRVYRAPAYFQNGTHGRSVMFNAHAALVDSYSYTINGNDYSAQPHHRLTAIDFVGGNGDTRGYQGVVAGLASDFKDRDAGYLPLLDYERLDAIRTNGITQNLLAYSPATSLAGTKNAQTHDVLTSYFHDLAYAENDQAYRTVARTDASSIRGHLVLQTATEIASGQSDYGFLTDADHLLVDKQDFNAPMAYSFADGHRMWYQRVPDHYVEASWTDDPAPVRTTRGWEGISLPFEAEIVTTQQKGELTHFYGGSTKGHEYWLRGFADGGTLNGDTYEANFLYPEAGSNRKDYTNTFLWDYYYQYLADDRQDQNTDTYQQQYYASAQTYDDYPYAQPGVPYIAGFPGPTYYEFDLSGTFVPAHSLQYVDALAPQVITLASPLGTTIAKSDTEIAGGTAQSTFGGYAFTPNYIHSTVASGSYVLSSDGSHYDQTAAETTAEPFRPYFTTAGGGGAKGFRGAKAARAITFSQVTSNVGDENPDADQNLSGQLLVFSRHGRIIVNSGLREATTVRIVNAGGGLVRIFTIQPGQTIETPAGRGIYIVGRTKIAVN